MRETKACLEYTNTYIHTYVKGFVRVIYMHPNFQHCEDIYVATSVNLCLSLSSEISTFLFPLHLGSLRVPYAIKIIIGYFSLKKPVQKFNVNLTRSLGDLELLEN